MSDPIYVKIFNLLLSTTVLLHLFGLGSMGQQLLRFTETMKPSQTLKEFSNFYFDVMLGH